MTHSMQHHNRKLIYFNDILTIQCYIHIIKIVKFFHFLDLEIPYENFQVENRLNQFHIDVCQTPRNVKENLKSDAIFLNQLNHLISIFT